MYIKTKTLTIVASLLEIIARKINKKLQVFFEILPYIKEPKCTTFSMNDKNTIKKFCLKTWYTTKIFCYQVVHQNSLTSCPGQSMGSLLTEKTRNQKKT